MGDTDLISRAEAVQLLDKANDLTPSTRAITLDWLRSKIESLPALRGSTSDTRDTERLDRLAGEISLDEHEPRGRLGIFWYAALNGWYRGTKRNCVFLGETIREALDNPILPDVCLATPASPQDTGAQNNG